MRKSSMAHYANQIFEDPTMYVVANRTEAVFYLDGTDRKFHFVDRLSNKKGHLTETELVSDKPGTNISSGGGGVIHHGLDRRFNHHEQAARRFARRIATQLREGRQQSRFGDLVLVAEPHFLGLLRGALDPETRDMITHEVAREYAQGSDALVRTQIMKAIRAE